MNGILLVNKPSGLTSRDVVNRLNKYFHTSRIGHTGTLDPLATGLLIICIGKYTKLVDLITSKEKEYIAKIQLGISTDTYDLTGSTIATSNKLPSQEEVIKVLNSFQNLTYDQEVPKYSAVKLQGHKLYEYARRHQEVTLPKRQVTIFDISLINYNQDIIEFKTTVSKGTYIRSLIVDICSKLNICGTMSSLTRTKQGDLSLEQAYTLEEIEKGNYSFLPLTKLFSNYEVVELTDEEYLKVQNGNKIIKRFTNENAILTYQSEVIAIYTQDEQNPQLAKPLKMLI